MAVWQKYALYWETSSLKKSIQSTGKLFHQNLMITGKSTASVDSDTNIAILQPSLNLIKSSSIPLLQCYTTATENERRMFGDLCILYFDKIDVAVGYKMQWNNFCSPAHCSIAVSVSFTQLHHMESCLQNNALFKQYTTIKLYDLDACNTKWFLVLQ